MVNIANLSAFWNVSWLSYPNKQKTAKIKHDIEKMADKSRSQGHFFHTHGSVHFLRRVRVHQASIQRLRAMICCEFIHCWVSTSQSTTFQSHIQILWLFVDIYII